jgi:succinate dehydrogenase / fumarate reductase, iron-sulfur subunit
MMQQVDVQRSQEFRKCIESFLCQNTCHVIRDHPENERAFEGPRFLMRIAELEMHPADLADRRKIAQDDFGSATATSPSAAPRSARSTSRSPTTR